MRVVHIKVETTYREINRRQILIDEDNIIVVNFNLICTMFVDYDTTVIKMASGDTINTKESPNSIIKRANRALGLIAAVNNPKPEGPDFD